MIRHEQQGKVGNSDQAIWDSTSEKAASKIRP